MLSKKGNGPGFQRYWLPKCYREWQSIKFLNILILIFTLQTICVLIGALCFLSSTEGHLQISLAVILGNALLHRHYLPTQSESPSLFYKCFFLIHKAWYVVLIFIKKSSLCIYFSLKLLSTMITIQLWI